MHPALLVDEILQLIFEISLDDEKSSLCRAARCCKAWKDPALDRIWRRLPSAIPLLSLLPGCSVEKGTIHLNHLVQAEKCGVFRLYAVRVKHIVHHHSVLGDLPAHLSYPLDNLGTSRIESRSIGDVVLHMSLSSRLRAFVLHIGYTKSDSASTSMHMILSRLKKCSALERLSVRGHSSTCLQTPLGALATLHSLSLHLSSLTEQTFMAVSALPLLGDLDIHADRLSLDNLAVAISEHCDSTAFFPSLQKLRIRAEPGLLELLCRYLPQDKLHSLHIDSTAPSLPSAWAAPFRAIATVASELHYFTIEHSIIVSESEDTPTYPIDKFFTIDHFRPLSKLPLRRFVLDSWLPPDFSDADIEEMTKWWPLLNRLDLGALTALENTEASWKPRISLASLSTLAKGCKGLQSLVIALDADGALAVPQPVPQGSHPLASLFISSRSRPDTSSLSAMLLKIFPSLIEVTPGFVGDHADAWQVVQSTFSSSAA
ncbi:hypothetical protein PAXRUDRAFT_134735 [Paxillus rubicundulus Ve08.2h10]|uniref:Unplaced genomic scaffold scaffold_81, whole genome shotgun sequence n=1 Tax=Paxillus rubicundulus Ve08.2h10 TaxID=930991 RepID=A0A0D0E838_9AGAM|nr:hypothetical protein PAXRUDRAFT_134735 [Paxillus rubicundulus Ve08.2h10]